MKKLLFGVLAFMLTTVSASAVTLTAGENVVLTEGLLDDAYVIGGNANIEADVFGDLYIAGGNVTINANVHEDLVVAGGRVTITGDVSGDLRVIGGQVAIYGNVGDDVVVAGGQVDIGKSTVVGGSLVTGSGLLTVDGEIKEDIRGGVGVLFLNGKVLGSVIVTVEDQMSISDKAFIGQDLKYSAILEGKVPEGVVQGEILFNKFERSSVLQNVTWLFFVKKLLGFLSALLLAGLVVLFAPKSLTRSSKMARENLLKTFGVGLLALIVVFIGSLLLMFTVIGIPISLMMLAAMVFVFYFSKIFVAAWLVSFVANFRQRIGKLKLFGFISLALLAYFVVGIIPYVGWLVNLLLFIVGVGMLVLLKFDYYMVMKKKGVI